MEGMEEQVIRKYLFLEDLESWLLSQGINETFAQFFKVAISLAAIFILALIADFIAKRIFLTTMARVAKRTKTEWDDVLVEKRFFHRLAHFAPAIVVYLTLGIALYDYSPKVTLFLQALTKIYMIFIAISVFNAFLDTVNEIYQELPYAKNRPIKGYLQVLKIIIYVFAGILIIGIIINKNPASILVGLGASTAVLMLVFKDVITGLVASIQLSANEMLKLGDWIEMPGRNLDGTVVDISLTTVKVQNFDNTITTVPPFALINESFKNWRGMEESAGRRVMKSIIIDSKTVKFCDKQLIQKLSNINLIASKVKDIDVDKLHETDPIQLMNVGAQTNLNLFRQYVQEYLNHHPEVNKNLTLVVRLKQPVEYGIPMEIYCFLKEKRFVQYEIIQSEILDHIMAALPVFDLKVFQRMSSDDIRAIAKGN
ncbi:MAG: mechanosensitive ion channel [Bacteroidales bacterium]|nr:mechanosensitive ion channel [Bacteroidales bacterium]